MRYEKYNGHPVEPLIELDKEAVEDFYELIKDIYTRKDFYNIDYYYRNGEFYLLIDDNENIIGTCAYIMKDPQTAELKRFRIKKDLRGKGLGKNFLAYMENKLKDKGFKTLVLDTSIMRESTLKFYDKMGFEVTGKEPFGNIELVYFKKQLA